MDVGRYTQHASCLTLKFWTLDVERETFDSRTDVEDVGRRTSNVGRWKFEI